MNRRLDVAARQETQCVAGVDRQAAVKRLRPFPLTGLMVLDLQGSNGLSEEEGDCSQIGVASCPHAIRELGNLLRAVLGVLHVPQVRLIVDVPAVGAREEVRGQL